MDILLPVSHHLHDWSGSAGRIAATLAQRGEGTLTGLYVFEPYIAMPPTGAPVLIAEAVAYMQEHLKSATDAGGAFGRWAADNGVRHAEWRVVQGGYHATVARESAWCDLIVMARGEGLPRGDVTTVGATVLNCGSPTLVVPDETDSAAEFEHVAIAWNGRVEGTRAVQAALPLLKRAKRVTLLRGQLVDPEEARSWTPARDIEQHLATHGVRVETCAIDAPSADAGAAILDTVQSSGADLLVMGAYGRNRFAEWVIGGATRHVLQHARVPVLMRH